MEPSTIAQAAREVLPNDPWRMPIIPIVSSGVRRLSLTVGSIGVTMGICRLPYATQLPEYILNVQVTQEAEKCGLKHG